MIDWIKSNKEWLFSGIGIVVLLSLAKFFIKIPNKLFKRDANTPATLKKPQDSIKQVSSLTPEEIINTIKGLSLLQQEEMAKQYVGLRVEWLGKIATVSKRGGTVAIQVEILNGIIRVFFDVDPSGYPDIVLFRNEEKIKFSGKIEKIDMPCINLGDVRIIDYLKTEK